MPYADPQRQREYQREWWAARRARVFEGKSCERCGSTERLELHHRDPKQKVHHRIYSWTWARIWEEVAKCEFLCRACHGEHHGRAESAHGSHNRYKRDGCRCDTCVTAYRKRKREHYARRRVRALVVP